MAVQARKAALAAACGLWAMSAGAAVPADFEARADALIRSAYPADGPGAAVIVVDDGRVVYRAGRGLADVEAKRPITPDTLFRLGSITKQFTAATVLKLAEEGKLSLEDPVSRFFPDYPQPGAGATVRQLLNHASGIQDYTKLPRFMAENRMKPHTTAQLVAASSSQPAKAAPGTAWEYNNSGYVLLGAIIEQVTGKPWHQAVTERTARPLGLATIQPGLTGEASPKMARGYTEADGRQVPAEGPHMSVPHAGGGLIGSVEDFARWAQALHHGKVVAPASYAAMTSPAKLAGGRTEPYGMGLRLSTFLDRKMVNHGGAIAGFDTDSVYVPSEDLLVAVFANSDDAVTDPSLLTRKLALLALGRPVPEFQPAAVDAASLEALSGVYRGEDGRERRLLVRGGKLVIALGEAERELAAAGGDRFFLGRGSLAWLQLVRKPDGAHLLAMHSPESVELERAVRTGPVPADAQVKVDPALLKSYAGTYRTEAGAPALIALGDNGWLTIRIGSSPPQPLRPLNAREFIADRVGGRVTFHSDNGSVDRITIKVGAREMEGRRVAE